MARRRDQQHHTSNNMRQMPRPSRSPSPESAGGYQDYDYDNDPPTPRSSPRRGRPQTSMSMGNNNSIVMNKWFQKLLILLFVIVVFDVIYVWDYFDGLDENSDGPEAGMHNLHKSRRMGTLYQELLSKLGKNNRKKLELIPQHPDDFDTMSDEEKMEELEQEVQLYREKHEQAMLKLGGNLMEELEKEVQSYRRKYETAMTKLGENPYPDVMNHVAAPFTPIPPPGEPVVPKKTKEELENEDTYGVDEHIVKILHSASVEIDEELAGQLPTWDDVVSLYGETPIIHGLEMCEDYRDEVKAADRMIGPAGMFNTGTNLLFELMKTNCAIPEARESTTHREPRKNGMRWQVPWGKHNPPTTHRFRNVAKAWGKDVIQKNFFPVVLIKDPYSWMGSQCRHKYTTFWGHDDEHCPNLIRWRVTDEDQPSEVRVKFALTMKLYESLLDMWNKWYEEWNEQEFPHITTRFEDLLFHGEEVTKVACDCIGGIFTDDFKYVEDSAKPARGVHKGANGLVKAILQYGDPTKRLIGFTDRDRIYASKTVDTELMNKFGYIAPPLPT